MADTLRELEKRLAQVEEELRQLKAHLGKELAVPWWEKIAGRHEGDKAFAAIVREGRKIREAERKAARAAHGAEGKSGQQTRVKNHQGTK